MRYPGGIDTITLKTPNRPANLSLLKITFDGIGRNGQHVISGFVDNMRVTIRESETVINGSLSRYLLGSNCETMSLSDNRKGLEKLSEALSINLTNEKITCLDYAQNIITELPPSMYLPLLGQSSLMTVRGSFHKKTETLYYKNGTTNNQTNGNFEWIVYDKADETGRKYIPENWKDLNVMRIEISLFNRPDKLLKRDLTGASLSNPKIMQEVINLYLRAFDSIYKINNTRLNTKPINGLKKLFDQFTGIGIQSFGIDNAFAAVEELRASGAFKHREYYSDAKREIRKFHSNRDITDASPLIEELTRKVHSVYNKL